MATKHFSDTQDKIEVLTYQPGIEDSGDLEAATKAITATAKGAADYTTTLTGLAVTDARIVVRKMGQRLSLTIDSLNAGATVLNYSITVNGVERATGSWNSTGNKLLAWILSEGQFSTMGTANSVAVFLWVNAGNAVVSVCQLWQAVGTNHNYDWQDQGNILVVKHPGFISIGFTLRLLGTGTPAAYGYPIEESFQPSGRRLFGTSGDYSRPMPYGLNLVRELNLRADVTVATSLALYTEIICILRSAA